MRSPKTGRPVALAAKPAFLGKCAQSACWTWSTACAPAPGAHLEHIDATACPRHLQKRRKWARLTSARAARVSADNSSARRPFCNSFISCRAAEPTSASLNDIEVAQIQQMDQQIATAAEQQSSGGGDQSGVLPVILWSMSVAPKQIPPERKEGGVEQGAPPSQIRSCGFECLLPALETTQRSAADPGNQCGGQDHHRGNPQT